MTILNRWFLKYAITILVALSFCGLVGARETVADEKIISDYFETLRQSPVLLRQFLLEMPKGGDLHNHVSGATYAEDLIDFYAEKGTYLDLKTKMMVEPSVDGIPAVPISRAYKDDSLYEQIILNWSMYHWQPVNGTANRHFFDLFDKISSGGVDIAELIKKLRRRAASENMIYIEAMIRLTSLSSVVSKLVPEIAATKGIKKLAGKKEFLRFRKKLINDKRFKKALRNAIKELEAIHERSTYPGCPVDVRYLLYAVRVQPEPYVLADLITAYEMTKHTPLVLGVNIVAPENNVMSRKHYTRHMEMISVIGELYPEAKRSLHAGELVLGQAVPEALRFHITEAVNLAGAHRIGHGTDIAYESGGLTTIKTMKEKQIAVEILLTSNELLLGVKGKDHPFPFYVSSGVPVVLAGDDPGMMRTTQTQEFFLAASRYKSISYKALKGFARNSIQYSFLDAATKEKLMGKLDETFRAFEKKWRSYIVEGR